MGASTFHEISRGKNAQEAFRNAAEAARYESGHGGYTGTIAEKSDFHVITVPKGKDPNDFAYELIEENDPRISDKWGPAGCILLASETNKRKVKVPQKATKASTENKVFKGTRKWVTYYVLYANGREVGKSEKKTDALNTARTYALRHDAEVDIRLEKRLVGSEALVAKVKPNAPKPKEVTENETINTYLFFGWASC